MPVFATIAELVPAYAWALTGNGCPTLGRVEGLDDRGEPVDLGFVVLPDIDCLSSDHYADGLSQSLGRPVQVVEAEAAITEALALIRKAGGARRASRRR